MVKKNADPAATRCPHLSNHGVFEKWRVQDTSQLQGERKAEFEQDKAESNRRYDEAFQDTVAQTSKAELDAFWKAFGVNSKQEGGPIIRELAGMYTNPLHTPQHAPHMNDAEKKLSPRAGGGDICMGVEEPIVRVRGWTVFDKDSNESKSKDRAL